MQVGERLKAIREEKNLSQGDIEHKTGLLRCYVSRCENGHTIPTIETLEKWAKALDINLSQLFADDGKAAKPPVALKNGTPKLNRAAANGLRRIQSSFAKMEGRDIAIVVGRDQDFTMGQKYESELQPFEFTVTAHFAGGFLLTIRYSGDGTPTRRALACGRRSKRPSRTGLTEVGRGSQLSG